MNTWTYGSKKEGMLLLPIALCNILSFKVLEITHLLVKPRDYGGRKFVCQQIYVDKCATYRDKSEMIE